MRARLSPTTRQLVGAHLRSGLAVFKPGTANANAVAEFL